MTPPADVLVVGDGPAGSVVAHRLAAAGARVVVCGGVAPPAASEGYSERTLALLDAEGLEEVRATLGAPAPRHGRWGDGRAVGGREWLADRARVAAALRASLARAGIARLAGPATRITASGAGARIEAAGGSAAGRLLVDARGRRGPQRRGPLLLAVGRRYAHSSGAPRTEIHALEDGWCWLADDGRSTWVQLVGRPRRAGPPSAWLAAAAARIAGLAPVLAAPARGALVARPAHARLGLAALPAGSWRAGDAALALDPLSGQGVYEALRGAPVVAAAVRTVLDGGDGALARRFVAERQHEAWQRGVAAAAGYYAENAALGPFWTETAAAYARLVEPVAAVAPGIERRPVLEQGLIRERAVIVTEREPRGVWQVDGVPVVALLELLGRAAATSVGDAAQRFGRPPAAIEAALHWLRRAGALAPAGATPFSSGG